MIKRYEFPVQVYAEATGYVEAASLEEAKKKVFNGVWDLIDGSKGNGVVEENFELAEVLTDEDHFVCEVEAD
jgi:hypothetical protein